MLLFLLLLPMTWRMIEKAKYLFQVETAARSVKDEVMFVATVRGMADDLAPGEPGPAAGGQPQGCNAERDSANGTSGSAFSGDGGGVLARISATLGSMETPADVFGLEMAHLSTTPCRADGGVGDSASCEDDKDKHPHSQLSTADIEQGGSGAAPAAAAAAAPSGSTASPTAAAAPANGGCCWGRSPSELGPVTAAAPCKLPAELCKAVRARIEKEEASQLPPLQVSLLVLILVAVAATNIPGGLMVGRVDWRWGPGRAGLECPEKWVDRAACPARNWQITDACFDKASKDHIVPYTPTPCPPPNAPHAG